MKPIFILLAVLFSLRGTAQSFEGKIVYNNAYKSKMAGVTDQQLTAMMGSRQEYYIRGGQYKSVTNGTYFQWQLYRNQENVLYNKMAGNDTLVRIDAATGGDQTIDIIEEGPVGTVLGYECKGITLAGKTGKYHYLFNPTIAVNPVDFKGHDFGNWYQLMLRIKAVPLNIVMETDQFVLESTAVEVTPQKLDDSVFALP